MSVIKIGEVEYNFKCKNCGSGSLTERQEAYEYTGVRSVVLNSEGQCLDKDLADSETCFNDKPTVFLCAACSAVIARTPDELIKYVRNY